MSDKVFKGIAAPPACFMTLVTICHCRLLAEPIRVIRASIGLYDLSFLIYGPVTLIGLHAPAGAEKPPGPRVPALSLSGSSVAASAISRGSVDHRWYGGFMVMICCGAGGRLLVIVMLSNAATSNSINKPKEQR